MPDRFITSLAAVALATLAPFTTALGAEQDVPSDTAAVQPASAAMLRREVPAPHPGAPSPTGALLVGAMSTVGPALLALSVNPPGTHSDFAPEASLTLASGLGVIVGPAVGLAYGGRGDLALRGLAVRGVGTSMVCLGLLGIGYMWGEGESSAAGLAMFGAGVVGAAVIAGSSIHDLAITPSATAQGSRPRVALGVRSDGMVAMRVRF